MAREKQYRNIDMQGSVTMTGLPSPTNNTDAVNKAYVDLVDSNRKVYVDAADANMAKTNIDNGFDVAQTMPIVIQTSLFTSIPSNSNSSTGVAGEMRFNPSNNRLYVKTPNGWRRSAAFGTF